MKKTIIASALLSVLSVGAMAETPSFNFVDAGYVSNLGGDFDFDGFEIQGNFELNDNFYINAGYTTITSDISFIGDIDSDVLELGLGYKTAISDNMVFFTQLDFVDIDVDVSGFGSGSENGYQLGFGVRNNLSEKLELKAAINYFDVGGSDTFLELGAIYKLTDSAGIYFDVDTDFDDSSYGLGVRFSF